ncbi:MAG: hypothetical protein GX770_01800 [Firmicutes bacterium]|nr:hypothetical protein [Bacillota bacterium]
MPQKTILSEARLFAPLRDFFDQLGYEVHGEVGACDLTASKDDELIIVEMKRSLNMQVLIQAVKRQRLTSEVYIAIFRPHYSLSSRKWKDRCYLVRRLELGLIIVSFLNDRPQVDFVLHPTPFNAEKSRQGARKKQSQLQAEIAGRHGNYNVGGSTGRKLMTAYKENAIHIACCLQKYGPMAPKELKALGTGEKTFSVLYNNYYGWFERVGRGVYQLSAQGQKEIKAFPELVKYYQDRLTQKNEEETV